MRLFETLLTTLFYAFFMTWLGDILVHHGEMVFQHNEVVGIKHFNAANWFDLDDLVRSSSLAQLVQYEEARRRPRARRW